MFFTVMHRISFAFIVYILVFQSVDARWHEELKLLNAERESCVKNLELGFVIKPLNEQSIDIITGKKYRISYKRRVTGTERETIYKTIMETTIGQRMNFFEQNYDFSKRGAEPRYYAHLTACYIIHTATQILEGPQPITTVDALAKSLFAYFHRVLLYKASALQTFGVEKGVTTKILDMLERYSEARYKRLLTDKFIDWYIEVKELYPKTQPSYGINMDELPAAHGAEGLTKSYDEKIVPLRFKQELTIPDCRRALAISDVYRVLGEESATEDVFNFEARFGVVLFQAQACIQDPLRNKVLINEMLEVFEHSLRSNHHQLNQVLESLRGPSDDKKPTHKRGPQLQPHQASSSTETVVSSSEPSLFVEYTPKQGQAAGGKQKKAEGTGFYTKRGTLYYIKRSEKFPADDWAEILTSALGRGILGQGQDLFAECIPIKSEDGQMFVRSTCAKGWKTLYEHRFGSNFFLDHFRSEESKKTHIIIASLSDAQKEQLAKILAVCLWLGEYDCGTQNIGIDAEGRVVKIDHGWGLADLCREESRVARLLESKPMWGTRGAHINTGVPTNHFKDFKLLIEDACFRKALREVIDFIKAKENTLGQIVKIQLGEMPLGVSDSLDGPLKLFAKQIGLDGLDQGSFPLQFIADHLQRRLVERRKSMELVCALLECQETIKGLKEGRDRSEEDFIAALKRLKETISVNFVADRPEKFMSELGEVVIKEVKTCLSSTKVDIAHDLRDFFVRIEKENAALEYKRREQETADRQTAQRAIAALKLSEKADDDLLQSIQTALDDVDDKGRNAQAQQFYKEILKKIQQATKSQLRMRTLQRTYSKKELRRVGAVMDMSTLFQQGTGE